MKHKAAWWQNPQSIVSCLVGIGAIGGWVITQFVADAKQQADIETVKEDVKELDEVVDEQEQEIDEASKNYMLIQQQLGVVVESLKELKQQKSR